MEASRWTALQGRALCALALSRRREPYRNLQLVSDTRINTVQRTPLTLHYSLPHFSLHGCQRQDPEWTWAHLPAHHTQHCHRHSRSWCGEGEGQADGASAAQEDHEGRGPGHQGLEHDRGGRPPAAGPVWWQGLSGSSTHSPGGTGIKHICVFSTVW